ncbi:monodehydroascorbate reductase 6 isoform X2 [Tasmannia lanceolata]|uniref:monodehydroascorbate reductase 6 isoform X2 n=1 Tax=Tasmannia lanceolata TaxID=3420 RepID=UPI0040632932
MSSVLRAMANSSSPKHGISLWCPHASSLKHMSRSSSITFNTFQRRSFVASSSAFANDNREYVIVGGGNAAGYAARIFVEQGMADGRLCIVSKEAVAPYERPTLTKGYLFPLDKKPARLPGFHTCVGSGWERQTPDWYKDHGIEVLYEDPVTDIDVQTQTLTTSAGCLLKYGSLIIATGCSAVRGTVNCSQIPLRGSCHISSISTSFAQMVLIEQNLKGNGECFIYFDQVGKLSSATVWKFPEKIGGNLPGVHYIRDVADADSLISSLGRGGKVVIIGGGYIGMEVAAAAAGWNLDTTVMFREGQLMPRLFTPSLARRYEELYQENGVKFIKGVHINKIEAGSDGRVAAVRLENGSTVEADTVDSLFRTSLPGIFAIGDVAAFPLKIYDRIARVEHVDHARKSAQHCARALLTAQTHPYDYLPYFYSRVFEYEGSPRKVWWQFYGDNVGDTVEIGNFNPKIATFWIDSGRLKGVFLESGSPEEFEVLPKLARSQPIVDKTKLQSASSVESALEIARNSL